MDGWIKLHRKLLDNPIFQKEELLQLFIYCLLKANHEPNKIIFNGQETVIEKGQFVTGRDVLSKDLKKKPITTYKRLKILENLQILNIESNNRFSLVTVVNYGLYQSAEEKRNSKSNNKGTTREQQGNTNKNVKNDKNDKNKNKTLYAEFVSMTEIEYQKLVAEHGEDATMRMIEILDNYKGAKGTKYKNDYRAILNWVIKRYLEEGGNLSGPSEESAVKPKNSKFWGKVAGYGPVQEVSGQRADNTGGNGDPVRVPGTEDNGETDKDILPF